MKITDVSVIALTYPCPVPMADAIHYMPARNALLVQVHTDKGITGLGEAAAYGGPLSVTAAIVRDELRPLLLGQDPFLVERLWQRLFAATHQHGRRGALLMAISGVDIALWDIIGQATRTPLYRILGAYRDEVQAYASAGFYAEGKDAAALATEMAGYVEEGFSYVKIKIGRNPEALLNPLRDMPESDFATVSLAEDLRRVHAVRQAIGPEVKLMVDANNAWTAPTAVSMMREMEKDDIFWFEEPVGSDDLIGSALVARTLDVPIAGYETETAVYGFRDLIAGGAVDIVQPDVTWSGGITECRRIAALAHAYRLPCIPHVFSSAVSLVANLHFIASLPNGGLLEFDRNPNPLRDELFNEPIAIDRRGFVAVPSRPGLGVTLNLATIEKYRVDIG
jgi:L-alanine-DL-glutamate epimerase-like enolase superfamily enzyme